MPFNTTIKPAQIEFVAQPSASFTQAYNVINNTDSPLLVNTSVLPWLPQGNDGSINYNNVPTNPHFEFSLNNSDLRLDQSFVLRPHENRQLVLKIKSLGSNPLGDSYFTFFINQDVSRQANIEGSGGQATARIGSHILISTSNTENPTSNLSTSKIFVSSKIVDIFYPPINITGLVTNSSDYFNKITGKLVITKNSQKITETELFPSNVLAHSSRQIACLSDDNPTTCTLSPPYWPGVYTVTINNLSTTFYVFPFSILIFCTILGGFIFSIIRKNKT
ncbi:MAG: hypothetical protein WAV41_02470 [Microgenomates group bacterium]